MSCFCGSLLPTHSVRTVPRTRPKRLSRRVMVCAVVSADLTALLLTTMIIEEKCRIVGGGCPPSSQAPFQDEGAESWEGAGTRGLAHGDCMHFAGSTLHTLVDIQAIQVPWIRPGREEGGRLLAVQEGRRAGRSVPTTGLVAVVHKQGRAPMSPPIRLPFQVTAGRQITHRLNPRDGLQHRRRICLGQSSQPSHRDNARLLPVSLLPHAAIRTPNLPVSIIPVCGMSTRG